LLLKLHPEDECTVFVWNPKRQSTILKNILLWDLQHWLFNSEYELIENNFTPDDEFVQDCISDIDEEITDRKRQVELFKHAKLILQNNDLEKLNGDT